MKEILIFGHKNPDTDSIMSAIVLNDLENKVGIYKTKACRLGNINKETQYALNYFNAEKPELIEELEEGQEVMLVDHNGYGQSANGREKAKILRVVDHHNISGIETSDPLFYMAMPVGCTCTILYDMYLMNNIEIEPKIAGLMLSAIISDTLLFKSPITTPKDEYVAKELAKIANIDINTYGLDMLKAGTDLSDYTPEQLINIDSKEYNVNGVKYQAAQVNTVCIEDVLSNKLQIENAIKKFINEKNIDLYVLMITDILDNNSQIIVLGDKAEIAEKAFNIKLEDNMAFLPGVVSRKKQVVPVIDKSI
ncbi:MAG: manganese-dependent inorganic pyrophosphatase [Clostridia bacterium]|nr:manganese-dependent inorganic pyrophosphatase [Clostridia bacterium]